MEWKEGLPGYEEYKMTTKLSTANLVSVAPIIRASYYYLGSFVVLLSGHFCFNPNEVVNKVHRTKNWATNLCNSLIVLHSDGTLVCTMQIIIYKSCAGLHVGSTGSFSYFEALDNKFIHSTSDKSFACTLQTTAVNIFLSLPVHMTPIVFTLAISFRDGRVIASGTQVINRSFDLSPNTDLKWKSNKHHLVSWLGRLSMKDEKELLLSPYWSTTISVSDSFCLKVVHRMEWLR